MNREDLLKTEKETIAQLPLMAKRGKDSFVQALTSLFSVYLELLDLDCTDQAVLTRCFRLTALFHPETFTEKQAATFTKINRHYEQMINSGTKDAKTILSYCRSLSICHGSKATGAIAQLAAQATELGSNSEWAQAYVIMGLLAEYQNKLDSALKMYQKALEIDPYCSDALFSLGTIAHDPEMTKKAIHIDPTHIQAVMAET